MDNGHVNCQWSMVMSMVNGQWSIRKGCIVYLGEKDEWSMVNGQWSIRKGCIGYWAI